MIKLRLEHTKDEIEQLRQCVSRGSPWGAHITIVISTFYVRD